jgi:hypothetical protein
MHAARRPGTLGLCRHVHLVAKPREAFRHGLHVHRSAEGAWNALIEGGIQNAQRSH